MDINSLLNLPYINDEDIIDVFNNRESLIAGFDEAALYYLARRVRHVSLESSKEKFHIPDLLAYLAPFSKKTHIPLFPEDRFKIFYKDSSDPRIVDSKSFWSIIFAIEDLYAQSEYLPIPDESIQNSVAKIQLLSRVDDCESVLKKVKSLNYLDECLQIEHFILDMVNNQFKLYEGKYQVSSIDSLVNGGPHPFIKDLMDKMKPELLSFKKTRNIMNLIAAGSVFLKSKG